MQNSLGCRDFSVILAAIMYFTASDSNRQKKLLLISKFLTVSSTARAMMLLLEAHFKRLTVIQVIDKWCFKASH